MCVLDDAAHARANEPARGSSAVTRGSTITRAARVGPLRTSHEGRARSSTMHGSVDAFPSRTDDSILLRDAAIAGIAPISHLVAAEGGTVSAL